MKIRLSHKGTGTVFVLVAALLVRFAALFLHTDQAPATDTLATYDPIAVNLLAGHGFALKAGLPDATRAPGFPFFLAVLYWLVGRSFEWIRVLNIVFDSFSAAGVFLIASTIGTVRLGYLAGLMYVLYPLSILLAVSELSESLFTMCLLLSFYLYVQGGKKESAAWYAASGASLGAAVLIRPTPLLFPIFLLSTTILRKGISEKWKGRYALYVGSFLLVVAPWIIRNYAVFDAFIPVANNGGLSIYMNSRPEFLVSMNLRNERMRDDLMRKGLYGKARNEVELDAIFRRAAISNYVDLFSSDPLYFVKFLLVKGLRFWYSTDSGRAETLIAIMHSVLLGLGLVGIVALARSGELFSLWWSFVVLIVYYILFHIISFPLVRYAAPIMPFVLMFTALGLSRILDMTSPRKNP